jgi:hypothetical protein
MQYKITLHVLHLLENVKKFEICYTICNIIQMHELNLYIAYIVLLPSGRSICYVCVLFHKSTRVIGLVVK